MSCARVPMFSVLFRASVVSFFSPDPGCDNVESKAIERLGTQITWICYSKGLGGTPSLLDTAPLRPRLARRRD